MALSGVRVSFRAKLLLALVGSIGALLGVTLVAIRLATNDQVDAAVARAGVR